MATGTVDIAVEAAAPAAIAPQTVNLNENGSVAASGIAITDPNVGTGTLELDLSVQDGTLALLTNVSSGVSASYFQSNDSSQVIVTGTLSEINKTLAAGNGLIYTPSAGFFGDDDLNIVIQDQGNGLTGTADVDLAVLASGSSYGFATTSYDASEYGGSIQVTVERQGSFNSAAVSCTISETGVSTSTVALDFAPDQSAATVSVTLHSGNTNPISLSLSTTSSADSLQADLGAATVTVLGNSQTPVGIADSYTVQENQTLAAGPSLAQSGLVDNDFDLDGDLLTVTSFTWHGMTETVTTSTPGTASSGGASLTVSSNGGFRYTPSATTLVPTDSFTYVLSNGTTTATATADLTIAPADPIITAPGALSVAEAGTLNVGGLTITDVNAGSDVEVSFSTDPGGGTLSLTTTALTSLVTITGNGTGLVSLEAPLSQINTMLSTPSNVQYTATGSYMPDDLTITENSIANGGSSATATVPITIIATGSIFSVSDTSSYVLEKSGTAEITVERQGSLSGSANVEYATADGSAASGTNYTSATGTLSFATGQVLATLSVAVTTNSSLTNGDEYFMLSLGTPSSGSTLTLNDAEISVLATDQTPVAPAQLYDGTENQSLTGQLNLSESADMPSAFDMLGDVLSLTEIQGSTLTAGSTYSTTDGQVKLAADGSFVYKPNANYVGIDSFSYTVSSPGATATGTAYINVQPEAPEVSVPGAQTVTGLSGPNSIGGISVSDLDGTNPNLKVVFSAERGEVAVNASIVSSSGVTVSNGDVPGPSMSATGTLGQINAMLTAGGLEYYAEQDAGSDVLTISVQDMDDSLISKPMQIPISVTSDYNATNYPGGQFTVALPEAITDTANGTVNVGGISFSGAAGSTEVFANLDVFGGGHLTVNVSGVTASPTTYGYELIGTLADINAVLANPQSLEYTAGSTGVDELVATVAFNYGTPNPNLQTGQSAMPISIGPPPTECGGTSVVPPSTSPTSLVTTPDLQVDLPFVNAVLASQPKYGFVTMKGNGDYSYTAVGGYVGPDQFAVYTWDGFTKSVKTEMALVAVGEDGDNCFVTYTKQQAEGGIYYVLDPSAVGTFGHAGVVIGPVTKQFSMPNWEYDETTKKVISVPNIVGLGGIQGKYVYLSLAVPPPLKLDAATWKKYLTLQGGLPINVDVQVFDTFNDFFNSAKGQRYSYFVKLATTQAINDNVIQTISKNWANEEYRFLWNNCSNLALDAFIAAHGITAPSPIPSPNARALLLKNNILQGQEFTYYMRNKGNPVPQQIASGDAAFKLFTQKMQAIATKTEEQLQDIISYIVSLGNKVPARIREFFNSGKK